MKTQVVAPGNCTRGLLSIMLAAVLWGTVGVAVKVIYGLAATNALSIGFLRLAISVPALFAACWYLLGWQMFQVAKPDLLLMLLIGVMTALYQVCYFGAIAKVGVAIAKRCCFTADRGFDNTLPCTDYCGAFFQLVVGRKAHPKLNHCPWFCPHRYSFAGRCFSGGCDRISQRLNWNSVSTNFSLCLRDSRPLQSCFGWALSSPPVSHNWF